MLFQFSRFCTVLINDESHSFPEVIAILKKSLNCPQKLATDLTEFVDSEGRAVIKVGSYAVSLALDLGFLNQILRSRKFTTEWKHSNWLFKVTRLFLAYQNASFSLSLRKFKLKVSLQYQVLVF